MELDSGEKEVDAKADEVMPHRSRSTRDFEITGNRRKRPRIYKSHAVLFPTSKMIETHS
jgi:hypothetical protein